MCGRFTLTRQNRRELAQLLGVDEDDLRDYRPRYNIAPTDQHFIVTSKYERRTARSASWGLVNSWATDNRRASQCINAKSETLEERRAFREAFLRRRCVVPADGFYEWRGPKTQREPVWIHPSDGGLLLFAGLYESWQAKPGEWERTFTIITTQANGLIMAIHDRMPVILDDRAAEDWMNRIESEPSRLKGLLVPGPEKKLVITPASPLVNSVRNDGPELLDDRGAPGSQLRLI
jgi:putative SOS response-associated peptidase YedK